MPGVATPTIGLNAIQAFSYQGTGAVQALNFGAIPTAVHFYAGTISWAWVRGYGFGAAWVLSGTATEAGGTTGAVLDILDGSGTASANTATTSTVIGLLIGANTIVNNAGVGSYRGWFMR